MKFHPAIAVTLALLISSPLRADWQYTRWGMTPDQVAAASSGTVSVGSGDPKDQIPTAKLGATGTYASGQYAFKSKFYFIENRLSEVRISLVSSNIEEDIINLRNSLSGQYGKPFSGGGFITTYHDQERNNRIDLIAMSKFADIIYRPLRDESASGL